MKWTPDLDATLLRHLRDGLSFGEAAMRMEGFSRNALIGRAHRLGHYGSRASPGGPGRQRQVHCWSAAQTLKLADLAARGCTLRETAERLGMPYQTVKSRAQYMKIPFTAATRRGGDAPLRRRIAERRRAEAETLRDNHADLAGRFAENYLGQRSRVSLVELRPHHCRFPIDQAEGPVRYCGADVETEGSSWCRHHAARVSNGLPDRNAFGGRPG